MNSKKSGIFSLLFCVLMLFGSIPSGANSAQTRWQGVTSTGTIVTEQDCPIVVEKEQLTFEINEFPQTYYSDTESFLSYSGKVTADYITIPLTCRYRQPWSFRSAPLPIT